MDGSKKIPFSLALSGLVLDDAKVKILLIPPESTILGSFWAVFWI